MFSRPDNQGKAILPMNSISEKLWYTDEESKNMRMAVTARTEHPIVWTLSKIENMNPLGLQYLTFYQTLWSDETDYIERDDDNNIIGIWCNYFNADITPVDPDEPSSVSSTTTAKISAFTASLKVGGSYKSLTVDLYNKFNNISEDYSSASFNWICDIDGEDWTNKVSWKDGTSFNQKKIKFTSDRNQLGKLINIQCIISSGSEVIKSEIIQFQLVA